MSQHSKGRDFKKKPTTAVSELSSVMQEIKAWEIFRLSLQEMML